LQKDVPLSQPNTLKSFTFVVIQFLCLALIAVTGSLFPANIFLLIVELLGFAIGVWAVLVMGLGKFNITPDPLSSSRLVTRGPYRLIRHPMYLALLLVTSPLVVADFSWFRLAIWLVLLGDLLLKLNYEEGLLTTKLQGYSEYKQKSYRFIPFVY
jgi:protein-S-isoprenylcysteine O-methyltransferase Ste14